MRHESAVSTVATSRQPQSADLPYYVPGVGAWPGHEISILERGKLVQMWRYEAQGPSGVVPSMRPVASLCRLPIGCAEAMLSALTEDVPPWPRSASDRLRLFKSLGEMLRNGGPEDVAQVWRSVASQGRHKKLTHLEREMRDRAAAICRSVLRALPDSPATRQALEILTDDRKPCPSS